MKNGSNIEVSGGKGQGGAWRRGCDYKEDTGERVFVTASFGRRPGSAHTGLHTHHTCAHTPYPLLSSSGGHRIAIFQQNKGLCSTLDGPRDYHSKSSESGKDRYHTISRTGRL